MSWQLVHLADVPPTPWKNGGGTTRELVAWPNAADWVWRLSVAEVASSGPFSTFDGVQRWFAVLAGAGVRLHLQAPGGAQTHDLTVRSAPLCFDGAVPTHCDLLGGPTQDFNLMLRQCKASGRVQRITGSFQVVLNAPKIIAVCAYSAGATVEYGTEILQLPLGSLAWQALQAGAQVQVDGVDALYLEIHV
jgi:environmental stress-induced protein Ves